MSDRETECTCDELAHPCDIHDTTGPPDVVRGPSEGREPTPDELLEMKLRKAQMDHILAGGKYEKPAGQDLAMRVGHLKLGRWLKALNTEGDIACLACPEDCVDCAGDRRDCECYEHQGEGPTDDQLRELIEMRDTQDRINELKGQMEKFKATPDDTLAVTPVDWEKAKRYIDIPLITMEVDGMKRGMGRGFHNPQLIMDEASVGFISEEEDYRLEEDPDERLRKKTALFHKIYGMNAPAPREDWAESLIESYEQAKANMLSEKAEKKQKEEKAEFSDLPPGNYWVKRKEDGALTEPISVSPQGVEYLNMMEPKTDPKGTWKHDPVAYAQMSAYAQDPEKKEEKGGKKKMELKPWNMQTPEEKKQAKLGFVVMGVMLVIIVTTILLVVAAARGDEGDGPVSPAGDESSLVESTPSEDPESAVTTEDGSAPVSIVELENTWYLESLAVVGIDGLSGDEQSSEGYTNDELIGMGRDACSALGETGGDFDLLFTQIYVLVGEDEASLTFAGKVVGAAVNSFCMEWLPAMNEYVSEV